MSVTKKQEFRYLEIKILYLPCNFKKLHGKLNENVKKHVSID